MGMSCWSCPQWGQGGDVELCLAHLSGGSTFCEWYLTAGRMPQVAMGVSSRVES